MRIAYDNVQPRRLNVFKTKKNIIILVNHQKDGYDFKESNPLISKKAVKRQHDLCFLIIFPFGVRGSMAIVFDNIVAKYIVNNKKQIEKLLS